MNKCQVCDGPIVNGRCKYCGMPYRNDEVLYHLNESRSDHYRHATSNARKIMVQQAVPIRDRKESLGRDSSREEIKAHHEKVREEAVKRMTAQQPKAAVRLVNAGKTGKSRTADKKRSRLNIIAAAIIILIGALPMLGEWIAEKYYEIRQETVIEVAEPIGEAAEIIQWKMNGGVKEYYLMPENGEVMVGGDIDPGVYEASIERGTATVVVYDAENSRMYGFDAGRGSKVLILQEGDIIYVEAGALAEQVVLSRLDN